MAHADSDEDERLNHPVIKSLRYAILASFLFGLGRLAELWVIPPIEYTFIKQKLVGSNQPTSWPQRLSLEEKLTLILQEVGGCKAISALFQSKDFAIMYRYPKSYLPDLLKLLKNPAIQSELKVIAIYAMEQLEVADYVSLLSSAWESYQKKTLDRALLERILYYELAGDHPIVKHYANPNVSSLLNNIWAATKGTTIKTPLDKILSGAMWQEWQRQKVGATFHWDKKPFPFIATLDKILLTVKPSVIDDSEDAEGILWCEPFMLLYEHPTYYIKDVYTFFDQLIRDYHNSKKNKDRSLKRYKGHASFDMTLFILLNAFRKLDTESFYELLHQITKLHIPHKGIYCRLGICYPRFQLANGPSVLRSGSPTIYDTLLLRPFPIIACDNILTKQMCFDLHGKGLPWDGFPLILYRELAHYDYYYQLRAIRALQVLYGIPSYASYSEERPFISFNYFNSHRTLESCSIGVRSRGKYAPDNRHFTYCKTSSTFQEAMIQEISSTS